MNLPPDIVETLLTRSSVRVLQSREFRSGDKSALFALNRLAESYLKTLIHRTLSFAKTNKRSKINYDDVELSLFMASITTGSLEFELKRLHGSSEQALELGMKTNTEKVARGFETVDKRIQNQLLGPELNGRAGGIPDYMERNMVALPALPPLYTHKRTALFIDRAGDGLLMREGVTRESVLVEESLRKIIEIEESLAENEYTDAQNCTEHTDRGEHRITDVMKSTSTQARNMRQARVTFFDQVWQEMNYGSLVRGRAVNCENMHRDPHADIKMTQV